MQKKAAKKAGQAAPGKEKTTQAKKEKIKSRSTKKAAAVKPAKKNLKSPAGKEPVTATTPVKSTNKPGLRSVYSNSKYTLLPLGFATDFKTKKPVVIFSDLATGQVHTVALSVWNRWKLKEVKKINTET